MQPGNRFRNSILRIRSAWLRSDPKMRMRIDFLMRSMKQTRRFVRLSSNVDLVSISHLEMLLPPDVDLGLLDEARSIVVDLPVFWEAPPERAQQIIALLAEHNSDSDVATFGYKLRTGGVTATQGTGIAGAIADKQRDRDVHVCGRVSWLVKR
jgi:hypothetical protein